MLNRFTKSLLVGTSLAPTMLIMAVDEYASGRFTNWWCFGVQLLIIAFGFLICALCIMWYAKRHNQRQKLETCKAKNSDKEVLTFLLAYLLPILGKHEYLFKGFNLQTMAVFALVWMTIYHSNAFNFSPMLGLLGYHFYEVEDGGKFPYLLISRKPMKNACETRSVVQLFDYTFLCIDES
jgi:hypothetical protein